MASAHHQELMKNLNLEFESKLKHASLISALHREYYGVFVKNTFLDLDDSDSEEAAPLMCARKTEPAPRSRSQDELLIDSSEGEEIDDRTCCSSDVSTDDECPPRTPKSRAHLPLRLPIPQRGSTSSIAQSCATPSSTACHLTPTIGFAATPSTVHDLTPRFESVGHGSQCDASSGLTLPIPTRRVRISWADEVEQELQEEGTSVSSFRHGELAFVTTPSTAGHLTPRYSFPATPSTVRHFAPTSESSDKLCNPVQPCTPWLFLAPVAPEANAAAYLKAPQCTACTVPDLASLRSSIEKTAWEKFEEVIDGLNVLSSLSCVASLKIAEGAHGWKAQVSVKPDCVPCEREGLMTNARQALISAAMAIEGVYIVGGLGRPFTATETGFKLKLAVMEDPETACWDTYMCGICTDPGCCQKQHLNCQNSARLELVFTPA